METQIAYGFDSAQKAARFISHIKSGYIEGVGAKLYTESSSVLAFYRIRPGSGFDNTCNALDELASSLGGAEL